MEAGREVDRGVPNLMGGPERGGTQIQSSSR